MGQITNLLFSELTGGDYYSVYSTVLNVYFPFGFILWALGFLIFGLVHLKTDNLSYSGAVGALYFTLISSSGILYSGSSLMAMRYFAFILALIVAYNVYVNLKSK